VNVKTAAKRLLKAPFRALGMDVVRWRPPKSQPVIPPEELEMIWHASSCGARLSYAQHAEDVLIRGALDLLHIFHPRYLDVGAHHPSQLSNTYLFYENGCRGVCIEPDPALYETIRRQRPRDVCLNVGIGSGAAGHADFYVLEDRTLSTFSKEIADQQTSGGRHRIERVVSVPLVSINQIIRDYLLPWPNLLSLDTEGLDMDILCSFDFGAFRPEVICVETLTNVGERKMCELIDYVVTRGYSVFADTYFNTVFVEAERWAECVASRNASAKAQSQE
jgi:FkbM family methyltransferase